MSPKRTHLTFEQKKELISDREAGRSIDYLKRKFCIGKTSIYHILSSQKLILGQIDDGVNPKMKRINKKDMQINDAILSWFKTQRSKNIPLNGPIIQISLFANYVLRPSFRKELGRLQEVLAITVSKQAMVG